MRWLWPPVVVESYKKSKVALFKYELIFKIKLPYLCVVHFVILKSSCVKSGLVRWVAKAIGILFIFRTSQKRLGSTDIRDTCTTPGYDENSVTNHAGLL